MPQSDSHAHTEYFRKEKAKWVHKDLGALPYWVIVPEQPARVPVVLTMETFQSASKKELLFPLNTDQEGV